MENDDMRGVWGWTCGFVLAVVVFHPVPEFLKTVPEVF